MIEFGRAMMTLELLNDAARAGARAGILIGGTNGDVTQAVDTAVSNSTMTGTTTVIKVNGAGGGGNAAPPGETVTVAVSAPFSSVSWLPTSLFLGNTTISGSANLYKE